LSKEGEYLIHLNYFANDFRKKVKIDLSNRKLIIEEKRQITNILFSEIIKIEQHKSWFGEHWNYTFFMGNQYNYFKIITRNKGNYVITCLILGNENKIPIKINRLTDFYPLV
jgi:hypothetical protein